LARWETKKMPGVITMERANGVATVIINNLEKRNSFTETMLESLATEASRLAKDDEIRAVILRGAGDLAFSAGADLDSFHTGSPETFARWFAGMEETLERTVTKLLELPQPLVAALPGACMGGGVQLALCADFRLASDRLRLGIPAVSTGIVYPFDAITRLVALCGAGITSRLLLTGATFSAEDASRVGLIEMVVPHTNFEAELAAVATKLASQPKTAIRAYKRIIAGILRGTDGGTLRAIQQEVNGSEETARIVSAALARRAKQPTVQRSDAGST
jgi:enoyl-CoA hydratase